MVVKQLGQEPRHCIVHVYMDYSTAGEVGTTTYRARIARYQNQRLLADTLAAPLRSSVTGYSSASAFGVSSSPSASRCSPISLSAVSVSVSVTVSV